MRWAHDWPNLLYAFSPIALIPQVIREQKHRVLLVALLWRNQHWFSELACLLTAAHWPIPLRWDLLSQANRTIWHPQPDLWALHLWPLDGSLQSSPRMCSILSLRLKHCLRDASMPLSGLSSLPGVLPTAQTRGIGHIADIVFPARAVEKGSLPLHAQGLCSSYSSHTRSYTWPISGLEQLSFSFSEGV